jgi:amidase
VQPIVGAGLPEPEFARLAERGEAGGGDPETRTARALTSRYRDWIAATDRRQAQRQAWARLFAGYDAVLAPVMPTAAFPHDIERPFADRVLDVDGTQIPYFSAIAWCGAVGAVMLPVVILPAGRTETGLPVGVQVIGPFLSDLRLLRIAEILDAAAGPGFTAPPIG